MENDWEKPRKGLFLCPLRILRKSFFSIIKN
jgi:hypothetical protein